MAQLRQDEQRFVERNAEVIVVGPEKPNAFRSFWDRNRMPFTGIPDSNHAVASLFGQQVKLLRLGRMPEVVVIDRRGDIRYRHFGNSMRDIPPNETILEVLDQLNAEPA